MTKTNIRKRAISILLILMVMLTMTPMTASAADGFVEVSTYEKLKNEVDKGEAKVKLVADIDTTNENGGAGVTNQTALTFFGNNNILDLNGHTLKLVSNTGTTFINVNKNLTIKDSGTGGRIDFEYGPSVMHRTTAIYVSHASNEDIAHLTVDGGTLSSTKGGITLIESEGNLTINDGKFYAPYEVGTRGTYAIHTIHQYNDNAKTIITGGEIDGVVFIQRTDSAATGTPNYGDIPVQIKGGTFKQHMQLRWTEKGEPSGYPTEFSPAVEIAGGIFEKRINPMENGVWGRDLSTKLTGGTFKDYTSLGLGKGDSTGTDYKYYLKSLGNSIIMRGNEIRTSCDWSEADWVRVSFGSIYGGISLDGSESNPVTVIPNAWGMKSVTLDGTKTINYAKDWYGEVERMDNSTAHTLKFEWYPLAQELKGAGYSYQTKCEHYISGSTAVQQTDTIAADKTSHTITIPAGVDPKVYSYDLQLNLQKDGSFVGIMSNEHIVKLVLSEAPPVLNTFISTVSFNLTKTDIGEPGELSFTATDVNGNPVAINPAVTWTPTNIQEGPDNHVSFTIPAPDGYTFSDKDGKTTTLKFGGVDVIGYVDSTGALNFSFPLDVPHQHKAASVDHNAKYHWDVCSCGQQIMNTSKKHTMGAWEKSKDIPGGGEEYTRSCTRAGCGYTETTISYENVKHVTSLVLNMENYPMDGMRPHNFVKNGSETKDSDGEYLLTERDNSILYPSFSITSGNDKAKLYAMNPESYTVRANNPDFAKWSSRGSLLAPECDDTSHDTHSDKSTFTTGKNYGVRLFLEAENGYAFYKDFNETSNFKLFTDMNGIEVETYRVEAWYYKNTEGVDDWIANAPADDSAGASKVRVLFQLTAKNEGDLNITLPELKAGDDLKETWAYFEGTSNSGTGTFVKDCYGKTSATMAWTGGPSRVIHNNTVTGESVTAQAGQTYTLTIPPVNENVLAHITIKNPTAASKIVEIPSGAIIVTYKLPAAADNTIVNGVAVSITPPAYDDTPSTTATVAGTAHCTASAVTWNPADAIFGEKAYTATVTLTADTDYTFADNAVFTINGHAANVAKNTAGSVTLSYTFPKLTAPHAHNYTGQPWLYLDPGNHYQECKVKDGGFNIAAHTFSAWVNNGDGTQSRHCTICKMADGSAYTETAPYTPPASSGGYVPTVQKPEITIIGSGKADLSPDGRTATITAAAGHELVSVVLNGKEMGKVEKLTGLKTGDKATITFRAKADGKAEMDKMIAQKASKLKLMARSKKTAKLNIKVVVKGDLKAITDAGYTVKYKFYRSTKKSAGYKAMLTKKAPTYFNTYGKKGTMYYYKARVMIYDKDGNFVAQTALKQCKYANRLWTK